MMRCIEGFIPDGIHPKGRAESRAVHHQSHNHNLHHNGEVQEHVAEKTQQRLIHINIGLKMKCVKYLTPVPNQLMKGCKLIRYQNILSRFKVKRFL